MDQLVHVKKKMKALSTAGTKMLAVDIIRAVYEDIDEEPVSAVELAEYTKKILNKLKRRYKRAMSVDQIKSRQVDLEELILAIKQEENDREQQKPV